MPRSKGSENMFAKPNQKNITDVKCLAALE